MTGELLVAMLAVVGVGAVGAIATLLTARRSLTCAVVLSPLTVVLSIAAGLVVGLRLMLIEGSTMAFLIVGATAPVALLVGVFVSVATQRQVARAQQHVEEIRRQQDLDRTRRELIAWLSHDLRTPLAGIQAMGEALEDGIAADPQRYYSMIVAESKRTSSMVSDLLSLAGLQSGATQMTRETVLLADLLSDAVSHLAPLAHKADLTFSADIPSEAVEVYGDAALLTRAFHNLIGNAIEYTQPGTQVKVSLATADAHALVTIEDRCGGLSDDVKHRMLEVGWRANSARTPSGHSGTGLGLPIVQTIASAHGGDVRIDDVPGGCAITLSVPLATR